MVAEQLAYYRARAPEYDKWFRREGLYDWSEEQNARWRRELEEVRAALDRFGPPARSWSSPTARASGHSGSPRWRHRVTGIDAALRCGTWRRRSFGRQAAQTSTC